MADGAIVPEFLNRLLRILRGLPIEVDTPFVGASERAVELMQRQPGQPPAYARRDRRALMSTTWRPEALAAASWRSSAETNLVQARA